MEEIELTDISEKRIWYDDGAVIRHPSGAIYQRIKGNWVLIPEPPQ